LGYKERSKIFDIVVLCEIFLTKEPLDLSIQREQSPGRSPWIGKSTTYIAMPLLELI